MRVLYATDGGEPASQALDLFERAAAAERASVSAVTVVGRDRRGEDAMARASSIAEAAATRLRESGFEAEARSLEGHPSDVLLRELEEGDFDLALLGAGNRSRLGRVALGSVSLKILRGSSVSTMIVHNASGDGAGVQVLVGTDGSETARAAVEQMIALLDPRKCRVEVVSVAQHLAPQLSFPAPRAGHATTAPTPEQEREWTAEARRWAMDAADRLQEAGFTAEGKAVLGAPAPRLLAAAEESKADLVVVGALGQTALQRMALGSISDQVVRQAPATLVARR